VVTILLMIPAMAHRQLSESALHISDDSISAVTIRVCSSPLRRIRHQRCRVTDDQVSGPRTAAQPSKGWIGGGRTSCSLESTKALLRNRTAGVNISDPISDACCHQAAAAVSDVFFLYQTSLIPVSATSFDQLMSDVCHGRLAAFYDGSCPRPALPLRARRLPPLLDPPAQALRRVTASPLMQSPRTQSSLIRSSLIWASLPWRWLIWSSWVMMALFIRGGRSLLQPPTQVSIRPNISPSPGRTSSPSARRSLPGALLSSLLKPSVMTSRRCL
jgi:hypothetical protein